MSSTDLDNREWFISGIETAFKTDTRISALIKGEK